MSFAISQTSKKATQKLPPLSAKFNKFSE